MTDQPRTDGPSTSAGGRLAGESGPRNFGHGVTRRALAVAAILVVANSIQMVGGVYLLGGRGPSVFSLFNNAVCVLFLLAVLNRWLARRRPDYAMSQGELLFIYISMSVATAIIGIDMLQVLPGVISYPSWLGYSSRNGNWGEFGASLPSWLMVTEPQALAGYYLGGSNLYVDRNLVAWGRPLLWWMAFLVALLALLGASASLLRRRWVDEEKLAFPMTQVPLHLSRGASGGDESLLTSKLFWFSTAGAGLVMTLLNIHYLFPAIPALPMSWDFSTIATGRPWEALRWKIVYWPPFILGLAFLMPVDMAFSMWVFNLFWKCQVLFAAQFGWSEGLRGQAPYVEEQWLGAYLAIALIVLWFDRHYLRAKLAEALCPANTTTEREALSSRRAFLVLAVSSAFIVFFCHRGGMSYATTIGFFAIYLAFALTITRARAQLGPPSHDLHFAGPDHVITGLLGQRVIAIRELGMLSTLFWFNRAYRSHPMPHMMEALKLTDGNRLRARSLPGPLLLIIIVAAISFLWAYLHICYKVGAETPQMSRWTWWPGWEVASRLQGWLSHPEGAGTAMGWAVAWGAISTIGIMALRVAVPSLPLHPVGYAFSGGLATDGYLPAIFVAWLVKSLLLRYGGLAYYRRGLHVALGFIVGDALAFNSWTLVLWVLRMR